MNEPYNIERSNFGFGPWKIVEMKDGDIGYVNPGGIFYNGTFFFINGQTGIYPESDMETVQISYREGIMYIKPLPHMFEVVIDRSSLSHWTTWVRLTVLET